MKLRLINYTIFFTTNFLLSNAKKSKHRGYRFSLKYWLNIIKIQRLARSKYFDPTNGGAIGG